ncbi:MAG: hypothetical protein L0G87_00465 [Renibacterium salmoninarum]|nr:hypothetical protein [Renibacterium salmoninarum]
MTLPIFIVGALLGLGFVLVLREMVPSAPNLKSAFERMGTSAEPEERTTIGRQARQERLGSWFERRFSTSASIGAPAKDLALLGRTTQQHYGQKALWAISGFTFPLIISVLGLLQGRGNASFLLLAPLLGIIAYLLPDAIARRQASIAREAFGRQVGVFFEWVAMEGYRGAYPADATKTGANIGKSWVFTRLQEELLRSQYAGEQSWDGLARLSEEIDVIELKEFADIMRLAGENDVSVYATLTARGKALRHSEQSGDRTKQNQKSTNMTFPIMLMGFSFLAILIFPALIKFATLR